MLNMLLLLLMAGLSTCAAETPEATSVLLHPAPESGVVAILRAAVLSLQELNETTIVTVLRQVSSMIQHLQPGVDVRLTVRGIKPV